MNKKQRKMAKLVGESLVEALEIVENELGPEIRLGLETATAEVKTTAKNFLSEISTIALSDADKSEKTLDIFAKALDLERVILGAKRDE